MTKQLMQNLVNFIIKSRASGTTTLIKKISKKNDVWIIVPTWDDKVHTFGNAENVLTLYDLDGRKDIDKKPILFDNYTVRYLCEEFIDMLQILEQTKEEKMAMYMKLPKKQIAEMLINCNDIITALTQAKNCVIPAVIKSVCDDCTAYPFDERGKTPLCKTCKDNPSQTVL